MRSIRVLAFALAGSASCGVVPHATKPLEPTLAARRDADLRWATKVEEPPLEAAPRAVSSYSSVPPPQRPRLGDDVPRELDLRGVPLGEALHLIASMAGVNLLLDAGLSERVDASFPAVKLDDALSVLLARHGLRMVEDPPGIFRVTRADALVPVQAQFALSSVQGPDIVANLQALVSGATKIVVEPGQNFLVVQGPERDVDTVARYLGQADRPEPQVLIEAEILEVALDDRFQFGVQHLLQDADLTGRAMIDVDQDFSTADDSFSGVISLNGFDLTTTVNAIEEFGSVHIVSSPRVLAVTNTEARIDVVTEVPYIQTTTSITGTSGQIGTTSQQSVAFKEAGVKLTVTPSVRSGGIVRLVIDQEFSEVVDFFQGIPVLDSRHLATQFLVREDQAVVLGGLIENRKTEDDRGVPILMHLPLLGRLFRGDDDRLQRRELLILITSRILDPEEAAALAGEYQRDFAKKSQGAGVDPEHL